MAALASGSATRSHRVRVSNVTALGCRVEDTHRFNVGDRLLLTIDPIGPNVGTVIWSSTTSLGFEFATPLHPAVLAHVERTNPGPPASVGADTVTLRDFQG